MPDDFAATIDRAWQGKDRPALLDLLCLAQGSQWRAAAHAFFAHAAARKYPILEVISLVIEVEQQLRSRYQFTQATLWRFFALPRVLQVDGGASFDIPGLASYCAGTGMPEGWLPFAAWARRWLEDLLGYYGSALRATATPTWDDLGLLRTPPGGIKPPLLHPLVHYHLRNPGPSSPLREQQSAVLCDWLVQTALQSPPPWMTVYAALAAATTVIQTARGYGVSITAASIAVPAPTIQPWADRAQAVLTLIVDLSADRPLIGGAKSSAERDQFIANLLAGPMWNRPPIADQLRAIALSNLQGRRQATLAALSALEAALSVPTFAPSLEGTAPVALPDRRAAVNAVVPTYLDPAYTTVLEGYRAAEADAQAQTAAIRPAAATANAAYKEWQRVIALPLARAALFQSQVGSPSAAAQAEAPAPPAAPTPNRSRQKSTPTPGDRVQRLLTAAVQESLAAAPLESRLYAAPGPWPTQPFWAFAVNGIVMGGTALGAFDATLRSWGQLDKWEAARGTGLGDGTPPALIAALPAWVTTTKEPAPKRLSPAELDKLRPQLAAVTLLTGPDLPPALQLRDRLDALLLTDLNPEAKAVFAAARLDLGLTLAVRHNIAVAFPQFTGQAAGRTTFFGWVRQAFANGNAWTTRAAMQGLILAARVAELTGDTALAATGNQLVLATDPLRAAVAGISPAALCRRSLEWLSGATDEPAIAEVSALPLAYVAIDLVRCARARALAIAAPALTVAPAWLAAGQTLGGLLQTLGNRWVDAGRDVPIPFITDLPARLLLLAVMRIALDRVERDRALVVRPLRREEVQPLWALRGALRAVFSGDALIQNPLAAAAGDRIVPWWSTGYWSERVLQRATGASSPLTAINWVATPGGEATAALLREAAALDAATPSLPPAAPAPTDNAVIRYADAWLWDFDGRYAGEFPELSWRVARDRLAAAQTDLLAAESTFKNALKDQEAREWRTEIRDLLRMPLQFMTADFRQQIEEAVAEVRQAEAELTAAQSEALAADFEREAADLLYTAARFELSRQGVLVQVTELDQRVAAIEQEIGELQAQASQIGVDKAQIDQQIAAKRIDQANLELEKASLQRGSIVEEIEVLRQILGSPNDTAGKYQVQVTLDDGSIRLANGQMAAMGIKLESIVGKKLADAMVEAEATLKKEEEAERRRRKKAFWGKLIKGICKLAGAVVGAILGGPAGAALGAAIGEALGEIGAGMIEGKSLENIVFGLADNVFDIAGAAGLDLEGELNKLGNKALGEVKDVLKTIDGKLGPVFDGLPRIIDAKLVEDAFYVLGADEAPQLVELAKKTYAQLRTDLVKLEDRYEASGGLGSLLKGAAKYESFDQLHGALTNTLTKEIFGETGKLLEQYKPLVVAMGEDLAALNTAQGRAELVSRWDALLLSHMVTGIQENRDSIVQGWLKLTGENGRFWSDETVRKEARLLLEDLYPNAETRAQVEASLRAALLDPDTRRGMIQKYLLEWQAKFDEHIQAVQEPAGAEQAKTALEVARFEVAFLKGAQEKFNTKLLPFLRSDPGESSAERDALFVKLDKLQNELAQQDLTIKQLALESNIREDQLTQAGLSVQQAETLLAAARKHVTALELNVEKASLLNQAAQLAKVSQENITAAQAASSKAAAARADAAKARITAAGAALDARWAALGAAEARGSEAASIRATLAEPARPLLDIAAADLAQARSDHAAALARALLAYRELLRFYTSIEAPADKVPVLARPDLLDAVTGSVPAGSTDGTVTTWGNALQRWFSAMKDSFESKGMATVRMPEPIAWELTPEQIVALASPAGLRIVLGPQEDETPFVFAVAAAGAATLPTSRTWVALSPTWRGYFADGGIDLAANTRVRVTAPASGAPIRWQVAEGEPSAGPVDVTSYAQINGVDAPNYLWTLERAEPLAFNVAVNKEAGVLEVSRLQATVGGGVGRSPLSDRFLEEVPSDAARTGRVVGLFLSLTDSRSNRSLTESDYTLVATHLGDVWRSTRDVRIYRPRGNATLADRILIIPASADPLTELRGRVDFAKQEGDPELLSVQGMPIAGTLVLRLLAQGEVEFDQARIRLLYKYFVNA